MCASYAWRATGLSDKRAHNGVRSGRSEPYEQMLFFVRTRRDAMRCAEDDGNVGDHYKCVL